MITESSETSLLERLVEASGLSGVFAKASIVRALERSGVNVARLTAADVRKAMPELSRALGVFMSAPEVKRHVDRIEDLFRPL